MTGRATISAVEARAIALRGLGLDTIREVRSIGAAEIRQTIRRLGLLQIDYVNVVVPAQYQVLFTRLGRYDRTLLDRIVYEQRDCVEQWAREASIVPIEHWPLLHHRRQPTDRRGKRMTTFLQRNKRYADGVLALITEHGAVARGDVPAPPLPPRQATEFWRWNLAKMTLEALFACGTLAIAGRRSSDMARVYDLATRLIPAPHRETRLAEVEARAQLLHGAARVLGVATEGDLADYYRMTLAEARPALKLLIARGALREARVEGWAKPAWIESNAASAERCNGRALLSPFDPAIWCRERALRLFGFDYRLEIWVPPARRRFGYYVLPFLWKDRLVARVDLKADRAAGLLRVLGAFLESEAEVEPIALALAQELVEMADWLGLRGVAIGRRGNLARPLSRAVRTLFT